MKAYLNFDVFSIKPLKSDRMILLHCIYFTLLAINMSWKKPCVNSKLQLFTFFTDWINHDKKLLLRTEDLTKMETNSNIPKLTCEMCDYSTIHQGSLKRHTNLVHLNIKKYLCTQCSKTFGTNTLLRRHINGVHLQQRDLKRFEKHFKCDICDKAFSRKSNLNDHVNTVHNNITRYSCGLCDYSSYTRQHLETHSNTVHLGKKDFKCDICDQAFSRKSSLDRHKNIIHKCSFTFVNA
jgi:uncharacterized Zn-finger protein